MPQRALTAQAVAELVGGRLSGNPDQVIGRAAPLESAGPDALAIAAGSRYLAELGATGAGVVVVSPALGTAPTTAAAVIVVDDPYRALLDVLPLLYPATQAAPGVDPSARLGPDIELGEGCSVGPFVALGRGVRLGARCRIGAGTVLGDGVAIGDDTELAPNVVCYPGTRVGSRCLVKAGAVLGSEGFRFISGRDGHRAVPHVGGCVIEDDVRIGALCCVDRGTLGDTVVGQGTKLDNQVHIGHNARVGRHCLLVAGVLVGGSTELGDGVVVAGGAAIRDHVNIGAGARIGACSMVSSDIPAGAEYSGQPARPHRDTLRAQAAMARLGPLTVRLERLAAPPGRDDTPT